MGTATVYWARIGCQPRKVCARISFYGIADLRSKDIDDFRISRTETEALIEEVLADEPDLESFLYVHEIAIELSDN